MSVNFAERFSYASAENLTNAARMTLLHVGRLQPRCFLGSTSGGNQPGREVHLKHKTKKHAGMPVKTARESN